MRIELQDICEPFDIHTFKNGEGENLVEICPLSANTDRNEDYNIILNYEGVLELIRTLQFVSNEIKPK